MDQDDDPDNERIPLLHQCFPRVRPPPRQELEMFVEEYKVEVVQGQFSAEEDKIIKNNFSIFCEQHDLTDCSITRCALLGFTIVEEDQVAEYLKIKETVKGSGFYFILARKLPDRLISSVYNRARKLLHPFRKQSELTTEEKLEIVETAKSMEDYKNMFVKIGNTYNCAPRAVQRIIETHLNRDEKLNFTKGKWQTEESMELIKAILEYLEIDIDQLTVEHLRGDIPWVEISKKLVLRCAASCKSHIKSIEANFKSIQKEYKLFFKSIR